MIEIEEIPAENIAEFWPLHLNYLVEDEIVTDPEDIEYFSGDAYRGLILAHMQREPDRHHILYFTENGQRIGAAQYNTYQSEDGKCFILDFWIFPAFRDQGKGHAAFQALETYTRKDGAAYYMLNSEKPASVRFWKSLGFTEAGKDEWNVPLFRRGLTQMTN